MFLSAVVGAWLRVIAARQLMHGIQSCCLGHVQCLITPHIHLCFLLCLCRVAAPTAVAVPTATATRSRSCQPHCSLRSSTLATVRAVV